MKVVIQRVTTAKVDIDGVPCAAIGRGILVLLGVECGDTPQDAEWLCGKIARLRIFADPNGAMNLSVTDIEGEALVVSQFTLCASTRKGNRPSFISAEAPSKAVPLYEQFTERLGAMIGRPVQTGRFGADMQITLVNDGPVTIIMDSRTRT